MKVFEGSYSEEKIYEDLTDDIFVVLSDADYIPESPQGIKSGTFTISIDWER
jgi:hypothetical protein